MYKCNNSYSGFAGLEHHVIRITVSCRPMACAGPVSCRRLGRWSLWHCA